jgi:CRP-like cAMP-binding protein
MVGENRVTMSTTSFNVGQRVDEASKRGKIDREVIVRRIEKAIQSEARKYFRGRELEVQLDRVSGHVSLFQSLEVVQQVTDSLIQIPITDVKRGDLIAQVGDELLFRLFYRNDSRDRAHEQMKQFPRTAALSFKQNDFEKIVATTAQNLLKKITSQSKPPSSSPKSTGLGKRVRRGAIFVDPGRRKRKIPLPKEIDILNRAAICYSAGETICREGDQSSALLLMMKGQIDVYQGDKKVNTIEGETKFIGLLSYFTKGLRTATLKALTESSVVQIPENNIAQLFAQAPNLALRMLQDLSDLFLKRESELRHQTSAQTASDDNQALLEHFVLLALNSVTESDAELRSLAFNRVHTDLIRLNLVPKNFVYEKDFPSKLELEPKLHDALIELKNDAHEKKQTPEIQTEEQAYLLGQMSFEF